MAVGESGGCRIGTVVVHGAALVVSSPRVERVRPERGRVPDGGEGGRAVWSRIAGSQGRACSGSVETSSPAAVSPVLLPIILSPVTVYAAGGGRQVAAATMGGCRARPGALDGEVRYPASRRAAEGPTPRRTTDRRPKAQRPEGATWTPSCAVMWAFSHKSRDGRMGGRLERHGATGLSTLSRSGPAVGFAGDVLEVLAMSRMGVLSSLTARPSTFARPGREVLASVIIGLLVVVWPHRHGRHSARAAPGKRWCRGGRSSPPPGRRIYGASRNCVAAAMSPGKLPSAASHCASEAKHTEYDLSVSPGFGK